MNQKLVVLFVVGLFMAVVIGGSLWFGGGGKLPFEYQPLEAPIGPISLDAMSPTGVAYVGTANCVRCHEQEYNLWKGSHHDLAMQVATPETVLGDFDNATFTLRDVTSRFYREGNRFFVRTQSEEGTMESYPVLYVFGVEPLQQYLVEFPGGRLQCLPLAWDSRPEGAYKQEDGSMGPGGQEWFHLYPDDEDVVPGDALFWTEVNQNWNFMCAECHSTNLQKRYDLETDSYKTSWSEINVACESCHGPGGNHVDWAKEVDGEKKPGTYGTAEEMGLTVNLKNGNGGSWAFNSREGVYVRTQPLSSRVQLEMCARCHARRFVTEEQYVHGGNLHDTHVLEMMGEGRYHADGQIQDEVYVYGSFVQSLMYEKGVRCVDCHDPHSLKLQREGNAVCTSCHDPGQFDTPSHHFHEMDGAGASCKDCHMLDRVYMQVDWRQDHSFRIPRPDLSVKLGTPNTCNDCHNDQTSEWALKHVEEWYGEFEEDRPHYGLAIGAGRRSDADADRQLEALALDGGYPAIARATAYQMIRDRRGDVRYATLKKGLSDPNPMVRVQAVSSLQIVENPQQRWEDGVTALSDPSKAVRMEAVTVLAPGYVGVANKKGKAAFDAAMKEYVAYQMINADRGSAHMNLGMLYLNLEREEEAVAAYRKGIDIEPTFLPVYINLADYWSKAGDEQEAETVLREAVRRNPTIGLGYRALGYSLVRQGRVREAVLIFEKALALQSEPGNAMTYALALHSLGRTPEAVGVLREQLKNYPEHFGILYTLATMHNDIGMREEAIKYAQRLAELNPGNPTASRLLSVLLQGR